MLELGRAGTAGVAAGTLPVLRDGVLVGELRPGGWREAATATVGGRVLAFGRAGRELTGRAADAPEDAVRFRARITNLWTGSWALQLDGVAVQMRTTSLWRGSRRYTAGGRTLAESGTTGRWLRRPTLTADPSLPLEAQVFLLWVELVIRRRSGGAAAAAAGAASAGAAG